MTCGPAQGVQGGGGWMKSDAADWVSEWVKNVREIWRRESFYEFTNFVFDNRLDCTFSWMMWAGWKIKGKQHIEFSNCSTRKKERMNKKPEDLQYRPSVWKFIFVGAAEDKWNYHELLFSERCAPYLWRSIVRCLMKASVYFSLSV